MKRVSTNIQRRKKKSIEKEKRINNIVNVIKMNHMNKKIAIFGHKYD